MQRLIGQLKASGFLTDPRVEATLLKVDRSHYCPSQNPYVDAPHPIGYGATISAPHMHSFALEQLKDGLIEGAKVLDVGSGSGYLTACMAHMTGCKGRIYGVEHIEALAKQSETNIRQDCPDLLETGRVKIIVADGRAGLNEFAPFDVIHVGATAPGLPEQLLKQLRVGGLMVSPIQRGSDQWFELFVKVTEEKIERKDLLRVRYVPLTDAESQLTQQD